MVMTNIGVKLVEYEVSPLQRAFLEWCKLHPYARIKELKIHEGVPLEACVSANFGEETVRFDKIAKEAGFVE